MPKHQAQVLFVTDADGAEIVRVGLGRRDGMFAVVDRADFEAIVEAGLTTRWFMNGKGAYLYVRFASNRHLGKNETVARFLLDPGPGRIVRYRDGDRLNLRRSNLYLQEGRALGATPVGYDYL